MLPHWYMDQTVYYRQGAERWRGSRWMLTAALAGILGLVLMLAACDPDEPAARVTTVDPPTAPVAAKPAPSVAPKPAPGIALVDPPPAVLDSRIPRDAWRYQRELIGNARAVFGLNAPSAMLAGQVHQESAWRADARSPVGASGLAQFMPLTASWISGLYRSELGENQPNNPAWALRAQSRYMRFLYDRNPRANTDCDKWLFSLSDYNGGAGWRMKRQAKSPDPGSYEATADINPGIHPANQRENAHYPRVIVGRWQPIYMAAGWGPGVCHA
jgi:soluble lytic murein transglycosylase-like protein